ncbi:MAG: glycosyltransferase [Pseudorhodobacter sp.]|nr:glycosyltransferase [Frankiaceae bacterium]
MPGNRWDLADLAAPADRAERSVSVVVTHFEQPVQLARTLDALARQTRWPTQVVVADDGSAEPPSVPTGVELVRQPDRGFRAAAARNLGAARCRGDLLVFLDADTSPEPEFLELITALPARLPELLAVGRRRHVDLSATAGPVLLPEPRWLAEAYERSGDLLRADEGSYRFVISAVLACSRWWFEELGGFDETFEAYGGEDWDLAHRSWTRGGLVAHVPGAVAWHDGPDAGLAPRKHAGSGTDSATLETAAVARRVSAPGAAYRGLLLGTHDLVVTSSDDLGRRELSITLDGLLAACPRTVVRLAPHQAAWFDADPRITAYDEFCWRSDVARLHLHLHAGAVGDPGAWTRVVTALDDQCDLATVHVTGDGILLAELRDLRLHRRVERWAARRDRSDLLRKATLASDLHAVVDTSLQAWLGGWA